MPINELETTTQLPKLGRISLGFKASKQKNGKAVTFPARAKTFCFSSDSQERIEYVAHALGGKCEQTPGEEGRWHCVSAASEIGVVLPADDERLVFSQWMESWTRGRRLRRCDRDTYAGIDSETGEFVADQPCVCKALELQGEDACKPTLRLSLVVVELLDAPGLGVWTATSNGWRSCRNILSGLRLIHGVYGRLAGAPLKLGIEEYVARPAGANQSQKLRALTLNVAGTMRTALQGARERIALEAGGVPSQPSFLAALDGYALPDPDAPAGHEGAQTDCCGNLGQEGCCLEADPDEMEQELLGPTPAQQQTLQAFALANPDRYHDALAVKGVTSARDLKPEQVAALIKELEGAPA